MGESNEGSVTAMMMLEEGPNQAKIAQKQIKFQEVMKKGEEDGINALPDCLLLEILSRLPSTKDAIRTGTLSKRWANLWTMVPTLIFTHSDLPYRNPNSRSDLVQLVKKTLTQCRQLKLKKFILHTYYDIRFESQFNKWIRQVISCNVEKLNVEFSYMGREAEFQLDQSIFINSCFTDMRLVGCKLNPSGAISWKNLRSLCISYMNLDEDVIVKILSGCPLLETLVLKDYNRILLDADLDILSDDEFEADTIEINAPNSLLLTRCPQLKLKKFEVFSMSGFDSKFESQLKSWIRYAIRCNVKKIFLCFWNTRFDHEFMLDQTLFTASCFTELTLNGCIINPVGAISWKNLRSLCISDYQSLDEELIVNILSGSPVLETLELDDCYGYTRLDITSKSLQNLVLSGYRNLHDGSESDIIEINAPNILSLTIQHQILLAKLLLLDISSLVEANLDFITKIRHPQTKPNKSEVEMLKEFIMNLRHVKELNIGLCCSEASSCLQAKGFIFPSNVKFHAVRFEKGLQRGALS